MKTKPVSEISVFACTTFEGVHCWPSAPAEVSYLMDPHRHMFNVQVEIGVDHDDRNIEFIMLKHRINSVIKAATAESHLNNVKYGHGVWNMGTMSCEQVARHLYKELDGIYHLSQCEYVEITVNEDGENGARVVWSLLEVDDEEEC